VREKRRCCVSEWRRTLYHSPCLQHSLGLRVSFVDSIHSNLLQAGAAIAWLHVYYERGDGSWWWVCSLHPYHDSLWMRCIQIGISDDCCRCAYLRWLMPYRQRREWHGTAGCVLLAGRAGSRRPVIGQPWQVRGPMALPGGGWWLVLSLASVASLPWIVSRPVARERRLPICCW